MKDQPLQIIPTFLLDKRYTTRQFLASNENLKGASLVGIEDVAGKYIGTTVESALTEIANGTTLDTRYEKTIYTQTADKTIANTTTETSMVGTGIGSLTLPANFLTVGKTIRIKMMGYLSGTNGDASTIKIKLGSTVILSAIATIPATVTGVLFELEFTMTCRASGATGTIIGEGHTIIAGGIGFSTSTTREMLLTAPVTINTTQSLTLDTTYQWGTARAGNTLTSTIFVAEVIN